MRELSRLMITRQTPTTRPSALNSTSCCTRTAPGTFVVATASRVTGIGTRVRAATSPRAGRADDAGAEAQAGNAQSTKLPKPKPITSRRMRPPVAGESAGHRRSPGGARAADGHPAPSSATGASRVPANIRSGPDSSATGRADCAIARSWLFPRWQRRGQEAAQPAEEGRKRGGPKTPPQAMPCGLVRRHTVREHPDQKGAHAATHEHDAAMDVDDRLLGERHFRSRTPQA